jgi:acyl carrier protein
VTTDLTPELVLAELRDLYRRRGIDVDFDLDTSLAELPFSSLDFSELALVVEDFVGRELNFGAIVARSLESVQDVVDFLVSADSA